MGRENNHHHSTYHPQPDGTTQEIKHPYPCDACLLNLAVYGNSEGTPGLYLYCSPCYQQKYKDAQAMIDKRKQELGVEDRVDRNDIFDTVIDVLSTGVHVKDAVFIDPLLRVETITPQQKT